MCWFSGPTKTGAFLPVDAEWVVSFAHCGGQRGMGGLGGNQLSEQHGVWSLDAVVANVELVVGDVV